MDWVQNLKGRGTTVLLLTTIFTVHFIRSGGFGNLMGAIQGKLSVG